MTQPICESCVSLQSQDLPAQKLSAFEFVIKKWASIHAIPSLRSMVISRPRNKEALDPLFLLFRQRIEALDIESPLLEEHESPYCETQIQGRILFLLDHEVRNFSQITPNLYRSGKLTSEALPLLQEYGIQNLISLTAEETDSQIESIKELNCIHIPFPHNAEERDFTKIIKKVIQTLRSLEGPTLIHCLNGVDRTGLITASYRIIEEGWSKEKAIEEMKTFISLNPNYFNYYIDYIKETDIKYLKAYIEKT